MKTLFLADLSGCQTQKEVKEAIASDFEINVEDLKQFAVIVAYVHVGSWGCDSSAYFLLRDRKTGKLYENFGSHCSCYGFEGQWEPEETDKKYLKSEHFHFYTGGYDEEADENVQKVKDFVRSL